jgi:hypothetical protein
MRQVIGLAAVADAGPETLVTILGGGVSPVGRCTATSQL